MDETKLPHPEPIMDTQYHVGQMVRIRAHARTLPRLAAQFAGKVGQIQVVQYHRQAAVAEHPLQREDIPAVAQILDGEGVPEAIRMYLVDAAPFSQCHHRMVGIFEITIFGAEN